MSDSNGNNNGAKPTHGAYSVLDRKSGNSFWHRVGSVWPHKDGQGFEVDLDSMPLDGRLTLRRLREERMQGYEDERQAQAQEHAPEYEQSRNHDQGRSR